MIQHSQTRNLQSRNRALTALSVALGATLLACSKPAHVAAPSQPTETHRGLITALLAKPVPPPTHGAAPATNPFANASFFVNPEYSAKIRATAERHPDKAHALESLTNVSSAIWLDSIASLDQVPSVLKESAAQSEQLGRAVVPVLVVYDLPNRDCAAEASAGELDSENDGERRYREEFIDVLSTTLADYPDQQVVLILEPDSLPNLVSNLGVEKCALSQNLYKNSIAYAISQLSMPNVYLYLDAAHAGWLGWESNRRRTVELFKEVLAMAGGSDRIRGFATNVSNYNPLAGDDGKRLEPSNPCANELCYVNALAESLALAGIDNKGFIIDTARNGRGGIRSRWGNWCNIKGAGLGERPQASPEPRIDAYYWVKPPGESDGVADEGAPRFDPNCQSPDAAPGAPQAGEWFESYLLELVDNANPQL